MCESVILKHKERELTFVEIPHKLKTHFLTLTQSCKIVITYPLNGYELAQGPELLNDTVIIPIMVCLAPKSKLILLTPSGTLPKSILKMSLKWGGEGHTWQKGGAN